MNVVLELAHPITLESTKFMHETEVGHQVNIYCYPTLSLAFEMNIICLRM